MGQLWSAAINPDTNCSSYFVLQTASRPSDSSLPRAYKMNALRGDGVCVFAYFGQHIRIKQTHYGETASVCSHISINTFEQNKRTMGKPCLCGHIFHSTQSKKNKRIMGKRCLCVRGFQHIRTKYSLLLTCTHLGHHHRMTVTRGCIDTVCLSWWWARCARNM
jgi:hypothetical protein